MSSSIKRPSLRFVSVVCIVATAFARCGFPAERPNVLIAISDDQSYPYASAYGAHGARTPAFDRVAREGVLFTNAFAASPGCSPCRAALLTGRHCWQIENAGTHASSFPLKYRTFPELLGASGYFVGYTGKGWGPGDFKIDGRSENPAGPSFASKKLGSPQGINKNDYAANFADFLKQRPAGAPFCFWYGATEPHRAFEQGAAVKEGRKLEEVTVPPFLPDTPEVRSDLLDYCREIEWFDRHLARMLASLEKAGELDNTIVIVTSDNGMAFPRAKANCYEYGIHMPLAIRWGAKVPAGRVVDDLVGFVDLTATIYEAAGVALPQIGISGKSLISLLTSEQRGVVEPARTAVFSARERHSSSRYMNLGYPQRAMRTQQYLYVWNPRPERWPAGAPETLGKDGKPNRPHSGYHDIDGSPTLNFLVEHRDDPAVSRYFHWAVDHRPEVEIFDIKADPACLENLAGRPKFAATERRLKSQLESYLRETGDPRILDGGEVFETYKRYSAIREFPQPRPQASEN